MDCRNSVCRRPSASVSSNDMSRFRSVMRAGLYRRAESAARSNGLGGLLGKVPEVIKPEIAHVVHQVVGERGLHDMLDGRFGPGDNHKGQFILPQQTPLAVDE